MVFCNVLQFLHGFLGCVWYKTIHKVNPWDFLSVQCKCFLSGLLNLGVGMGPYLISPWVGPLEELFIHRGQIASCMGKSPFLSFQFGRQENHLFKNIVPLSLPCKLFMVVGFGRREGMENLAEILGFLCQLLSKIGMWYLLSCLF